MPFIMVTPLIQVFGFCCFLVPCLFYGFNIASAGTFTVTYSYVTPFICNCVVFDGIWLHCFSVQCSGVQILYVLWLLRIDLIDINAHVYDQYQCSTS